MSKITLTFNGAQAVSRKLGNIDRALPDDIARGLNSMGATLLKSMTRKVSGPGFTRNPQRSSPYPGVYKGNLFRSLFSKVNKPRLQLRVGPNVEYAYHLEFKKGKGRYPFVGPTLDDTGDKAMDDFMDQIRKALR